MNCGNLLEDCRNPAIDWHPHMSTCFASATTQWAWRRLREKHKNFGDSLDSLHPTEGVAVWVSTIAPPEGEDQFA